ncbi:unnamed protein product, partial [Effrenium voratum]
MATAELPPFPEFFGTAPFREVELRVELPEARYALWLGQDQKEHKDQVIAGLQRFLGLNELPFDGEDKGFIVRPTQPIPARAFRLRPDASPQDLQRKSRRPPLKNLLQLVTRGACGEHFRAGVCTAYGPRIANEDSFLLAEATMAGLRAGIFAVCDGHGGSSVSERLPELLQAALLEHCAAGITREAVEAAFVQADTQLREEDVGDRCGSTCVCGLVWPNGDGYRVLLANLGDSRGLLYRARGDWEHLAETCDHKPDIPFEKKRIRAAGGYVLPKDDESPARLDGVLAMSRAFGNFRFKDDGLAPGERKVSSVPEVAVFDAAAGDVILRFESDWSP